jgi:hypothetical protein
MSSIHLRRILTNLVIALGVSLVTHFVLFVIVASITNESSVWVRTAEAILTPAEGIVEHIAPGHSGAQIFYGFVVSVALYTLVLWPLTALLSLRRKLT